VQRRVAFAASADMLELDGGWPLLRDAMARVGLAPEVAIWDDASIEWAAFDLVVANYTWGYVMRRDRFLDWTERVAGATRLVNSAPVLRWNSEKGYLGDLARAGIPTVPTTFVPPGARWEPPARDYVVKPSVSSGGIEAARYVTRDAADARRHVERLHGAGRTALVQPYLPAVDADGETALVHFGGRFSHAVAKGPVLAPDAEPVFGLWERQTIAPREPRADQRALAERTLRAVHERFGETTAYARVDVVDAEDGRPVVMELELVEPALFLDRAPRAPARFADELQSRPAS
jgi:glutathione synthase/RimK-type ligase-like ATP-grasp enzyme